MRQVLDIERIADDLLRARDNGVQLPPPSHGDAGFDLAGGYCVGAALHERLLGRGFRSVGRKIGATNPATWSEFHLESPIWSHVYDRTLRGAERGRCTLSLNGMAAPRIEPEVILKLRSTLPAGNLTAEALAPFIEWASIGFEVVDSHYPDWRFTGADAAADFGLHAVLVIGTPWLIGSESAEHLLPALEGLRVTLRSNQGFLAKGEGRNALGSPLLALCQLHDVLGGQSWAPPLVAGEVITTGTLTALPYVHPGECYRVEIEGAPLGHLELEFCT